MGLARGKKLFPNFFGTDHGIKSFISIIAKRMHMGSTYWVSIKFMRSLKNLTL